MQSTQIIDSTAFTGSRLSTHRSSGKTASISNNRKMCVRPAANLMAAAEPFLAHRKNIRHEETTSSNKVASRFQLKREQELCIEQNGRKRVSFSSSRLRVLLSCVRSNGFFFPQLFCFNKPPLYLLSRACEY